jgi:hypothetical protein
LREDLEGEELTNLLEAEKVFGRIVRRYNEECTVSGQMAHQLR